MFKLAAFADEADRMISGQIDALKENGIPYIELRVVDGVNISDLSLSQARSLRNTLDSNNIIVWSLGSPIGKAEITDDFRPQMDKLLHTLELADVLGAEHIRLFSFYHSNVPFSPALRDDTAERLARFCEAADGSGVTLCHENEKGIYGDTAERCYVLHRLLPKLRAVFDPANFAQCGERTADAWDLISGYVEYMHIKDVNSNGTVVPAGHGICDIGRLIKLYSEVGGEVLTIEPHLSVFDGFDALEKPGEKTNIDMYRYPSRAAAFRAAADALKTFI